MALTGKTIGELTELSAITETTLFPVQFSGGTFNIPYSSITTNIKPYKVYTTLLTQTGGDNIETLSSGPVTQGVTYYLDDSGGGDTDFTNVGGPAYPASFVYFVATNSDTPNDYNGAILQYNTGAPIPTVLENTIGNIWWVYGSVGYYIAYSDNLFTLNKTTVFLEPPSNLYNTGFFEINDKSINSVGLTYANQLSGNSDNNLVNTTIEIRVYN